MKTFYLLLNSFCFNVNRSYKYGRKQVYKYQDQVNSRQPLKNPVHTYFINRVIVIIFCLFFSKENIAQTNPEYTRSYLNNLVEIGLSDYGLITAEDSTQLYFIAVRRSLTEKDAFPEKIANSIKQVKFYGNS